MKPVSDKEMQAVLRLDGPARFERFIKVVTDTEQVWGLWDEGWALLADDSGKQVFPLWPAREYAAACRSPNWVRYEPTPIALDSLLNELLPKLREGGVLVGVFPTPSGRGVTPDLNAFEIALREELDRYT